MNLTLEDKVLLKLLFEPEKVKSLLMNEEDDKALPDGVPDWKYISEQALREGVSAVLFHNIKSHHLEDLVPQDRCKDLSNQYFANLKRNLLIISALRDVLTAFHKVGISCIVLKGIALAERVYPNVAMRGMSDVDILVRKADLFKVDDHLSSLGYASRDSSVTRAVHNPVGYLASLEYRRNDPSPLNLHIHWHPVNSSVPAVMFAERIDVNWLWENAVTTTIADSPVLMLRPEHLIIYLCEHALRIGHSFDRLILVCDIFYAVKVFEHVIDWDFVIEESRRFNLSRLVYHGLSIVRHHASPGIPDACIAKLRPPDISRGEKYFLKLQFSNRRIRGSSYFIYLAMNKGLFAKIGFIIRTFFPPVQILLQRQYRKESEFSGSLYFFRIGEIVSHIWKLLVSGRRKTPENS
jgi:hypothetical protein